MNFKARLGSSGRSIERKGIHGGLINIHRPIDDTLGLAGGHERLFHRLLGEAELGAERGISERVGHAHFVAAPALGIEAGAVVLIPMLLGGVLDVLGLDDDHTAGRFIDAENRLITAEAVQIHGCGGKHRIRRFGGGRGRSGDRSRCGGLRCHGCWRRRRRGGWLLLLATGIESEKQRKCAGGMGKRVACHGCGGIITATLHSNLDHFTLSRQSQNNRPKTETHGDFRPRAPQLHF